MKTRTIKNYLKNAYKVQSVPRGTDYWTRVLIQKAIDKFTYDFQINGLPVTIPRDEIEKALIINGHAVFVEKFGKVWCPFGYNVWGRKAVNVYDTCIKFVGSNPILRSATGYDMLDGVIVYNCDMDKIGGSLLLETIQRYSALLAHCESTYVNTLITKRTARACEVEDSEQATAMDNFYNSLEVGDTKAFINPNAFSEIEAKFIGIDNNILPDFSQTRDYLMNCFLNEIGIQTLEEKKERFVVDELEVDDEVLNINTYSYYKNRVDMVKKLNLKYNLNLTVTLRG